MHHTHKDYCEPCDFCNCLSIESKYLISVETTVWFTVYLYVHEHNLELPWLWDVKHRNSYTSLALV